MLPLALTFLAAGVFVWRSKRPSSRPHDSREFRMDERAMSAVLFVLGVCLLVLDLATRMRGLNA